MLDLTQFIVTLPAEFNHSMMQIFSPGGEIQQNQICPRLCISALLVYTLQSDKYVMSVIPFASSIEYP